MDQNSDLDHFQVPSCSLFRMPWSRMPKYSSMDNCLTDRDNSKRVTVLQDLSQFECLIKMKFLPARHLCYFWPKFLRMEYWANLHTLWRWCNQQPSLLSEKNIQNQVFILYDSYNSWQIFKILTISHLLPTRSLLTDSDAYLSISCSHCFTLLNESWSIIIELGLFQDRFEQTISSIKACSKTNESPS